MQTERMTRAELRAGASLAGIFGLRMLGLFLILPVFALHAPQLAGGDDLALVGIALGAYGLSQALLQIPFGMASDRWGRKPLIVAGLLVFAAGSLLAAMAEDIWTTIAGRALQGAGAISSVVVALAADLTREGHRTKVMAAIGAMIGLAFALSLVAAPPLYRSVGMSGIFGLTAALALGAIVVVVALVPEAPRHVHAGDLSGGLRAGLQPELLRLNFGIFVLHLVQMAMFVVVPGTLVAAGLALADHWKFYLPVVLGSFLLMAPLVMVADRRSHARTILIGAIALLAAVQGLFHLAGLHLGALGVTALAFFTAFNVLEALLPSLVTRLAPAASRGAAIGVFNTTQTLGLFAGGLVGGWIAGRWGAGGVFVVCAALALAWLAVATRMRPLQPVRVNAGSGLAFGEHRNS